MPFSFLSRLRRHHLIALTLVLAAVTGVLLYETYSLTYGHALDALKRDARTAARLRVAVLQSELDKQRSVPVILADDTDVFEALAKADPARFRRVSQKLERLREETRSAVIYVIDLDGTARAASNWARPESFVGADYSFRPYFQQALNHDVAEQFALGTVSRKPGLYMAHSIVTGQRILGVVVVKMEFDAIEAGWAGLSEDTYVTGPAGEVLLTARAAQRFHRPPELTPGHFTTDLPAPVPGWTLHVVSPDRSARTAALTATLSAALGIGLVLTLIAWQWRRLRQRRASALRETQYRERLEHDVAARTEALSQSNERLSEEVRERRVAERRLSRLQADLVQANKLASLGQITAGVAHEINQPVATIRVLADTAARQIGEKRGGRDLLSANLSRIIEMCERIGHITGELRTFSRKASGEVEPVPLKDTIESSILLNESRLRENRVRLDIGQIDPALKVMAGRVRLEQVLVNLLQNAFEALEHTPGPRVRLSLTDQGDHILLHLSDNGPGLSDAVMAQLFTPFVTTKPSGLGLGLVIAHDILRDFGGGLDARNGPDGATFILTLRKAR